MQTGRLQRFGGLVSLLRISPAFATTIVLNWDTDVKAYLKMCEGGLPEADRPKHCSACFSERVPHRHGSFTRRLFTLNQVIALTIFRFLCPDCRATSSVLPSFAEPHHQTGVDVKEAIVISHEAGESLSRLAEESSAYAGGGYAEKTLRRWRRAWALRREAHEPKLLSLLIQRGIDAPLPRERHSPWVALQMVWQLAKHPGSLFAVLLRLDRSATLTASDKSPTIAGRS